MAGSLQSAHSAGGRREWPLLDYQPTRPWLWALALGLITSAGFQPIGLWFCALPAAGALAMLTARAHSVRQAAWLGWLFGAAHFSASNNWIATAFTHQSQMPAFLGWVAVVGVALYLAIYPMLAALATRAIVRSGPGWAQALVFAGLWVIAEWLRSWVFGGYAWNPLAMILLGPFDRTGLAAIAPLMGTYALSGTALIIGTAVLLLAQERRWRTGGLVAALMIAGMYWPAGAPSNGDLRVTVVQPNLEQARLDNPARYEDNFLALAQLSPDKAPDSPARTPRILLWPESGMADYLQPGYPQRYYDRATAFADPLRARRRLGAVAGRGSVLLTGAVDLEIGNADGFARAVGARNAVTVLAANGSILGRYFKAHLVPGGEYLPLRGLLEPIGLSRLVAGTFDFWPGPGPRTLDLGAHGKVGVQICYEIIFSGQVTQNGNRPDYLINGSNDGWFGAFGPPQFLAQARMRAVEEGLPVLRSTTTGISAVIDARGVVQHHLADRVAGRIDTVVPRATAPTPFALLGNGLALAWAVFFAMSGILALQHGNRQPVATA